MPCTELLVLGGRSLPHALAMLVPAAWTDPTPGLDDEVRAFYEYHAALVEPWDGPAALLASDGGSWSRRSTATACARCATSGAATGSW